MYIYIYRCIYACVLYKCTCVCECVVFANGLGDQGSIPGRIIPKIQKNGT